MSIIVTVQRNEIDIQLSNTGPQGPTGPAGAALTWNEITTNSTNLAVSNGYVMNNPSRVIATLPTTAAQFSVISIRGKGAGGWQIAQNVGQTIHIEGNSTTTGASGSLNSSGTFDCVDLLCITANTDFLVTSSMGNLQGV